jgi:hypothetical protein
MSSGRSLAALKFDAQAERWRGPFKIDVLDPSGNVIFTDHGAFTLTRIAVESLD